MTQLCRFRKFQVEYILVYLRSKRPQTLSLSDWVSCSCRFTKAQQLQIFICLPEVPLPADQSFLWGIIGRQWKLSLGNLFLGQESDSSVRLLQWPLTLVCHMQHNNMSKEESCAFHATSEKSKTSCGEISPRKFGFWDTIIAKTSFNLLNGILHIILNVDAKKKS